MGANQIKFLTMLKRLFLIWIFSGSLDGFSQVYKIENDKEHVLVQAPDGTFSIKRSEPKPDTLRAIMLVTLSPNGIAHARMGYVVIFEGKEVVYLDCRKRALKRPAVGWGYRVVGKND